MLRFQYISCQFDTLHDLPGPRTIREALRNLPEGLDATYDRILQSIKPKYRKPVANILKWLAFSARPLRVQEVAEVFILDRDRKPPFDEEDRLNLPESVLNYLSSLVTRVAVTNSRYDNERNGQKIIEVRLAHFSIKEYLISPRIVQGPAEYFSTTEADAHLHISEACLAYHLHLSLGTRVTYQEAKRFALWKYAGRYWVHHLEQVPRASWTSFASEMALKALAPSSQSLLNMVRIFDPESGESANWKRSFSGLAAPLYYMDGFGAIQLTELLLDNGVNIDEFSSGMCGFALQIAAANGNESLMQLLLDRGADINIQGGYFGSALQAAVINGNESHVQLLLDRGADVNIQGGFHGSAIAAAASIGSKGKIQLLLDRGAYINAKSGYYGTALYAALAADKIDSAELLVSRGAEVNLPGPEREEIFRRLADVELPTVLERLCKFQEDPSGYFAGRRRTGNGMDTS